MANAPHNSKRPESAGVRKALKENDIEMLKIKLTPRQRAFCHEYVVDKIGAAAVIRAGYSIKNADRMAYLLRQNKGVQAYIDHLLMSRDAKIVAIDPDYVIAGITRIISKSDVKDSDALRAYELLARHLSMFVDRTEISGRDGGAIEVDQRRIDEEAQSFTHLLNGMAVRADKESKIN